MMIFLRIFLVRNGLDTITAQSQFNGDKFRVVSFFENYGPTPPTVLSSNYLIPPNTFRCNLMLYNELRLSR